MKSIVAWKLSKRWKMSGDGMEDLWLTDGRAEELIMDCDNALSNRWQNKYKLNTNLIRERQLTDIQVRAIEKIHEERLAIEETMANTDHPELLHQLFSLWTDNQLRLQAAWGFTPDDTYHKFWRVPRCTCPQLDNEDRYPSKAMVISDACPVHGRASSPSQVL